MPPEIASFGSHMTFKHAQTNSGSAAGMTLSQKEVTYLVDVPLDDASKEVSAILVPHGYRVQPKMIVAGNTIAGFDNGTKHYSLEHNPASDPAGTCTLKIYSP